MRKWYEPKKQVLHCVMWPILVRRLKDEKLLALVQSRYMSDMAEEHGIPKSKIRILPLKGVGAGTVLAVTPDDYAGLKKKYDSARAALEELAESKAM